MPEGSISPETDPFLALFWKLWPEARLRFAREIPHEQILQLQVVLEKVVADLDAGFRDPRIFQRTLDTMAGILRGGK